jgi:hypothetical protein
VGTEARRRSQRELGIKPAFTIAFLVITLFAFSSLARAAAIEHYVARAVAEQGDALDADLEWRELASMEPGGAG